MRAAYIEQTGPPEAIQVGDLPVPVPGPGQILVRVRASALNPIDLYIRSGMVAMPMGFPHVIGADFAGTVEGLGPGATRYKVGDGPARLREFSSEGIDVWYETLRDPNLEVNVPLLRRRGRMIVIAGRAAKPPLPFGSFYPRDCSILGFAMFNASPDEQRRS